LANIVLPNVLGVGAVATLNEAMAFVGISCIVFNEGVAYMVIRRVRDAGLALEAAGPLLSQSTFEHFVLACTALGCTIGVIWVVNPQHHYDAHDWLLVGATGLMVAAYIPCVAVLTATLRNQVVLGLALLNGILSFVFPVGLHRFGLDIRLSIGLTYGLCFLVCMIYFRAQGMGDYLRKFDPAKRIFLRLALLPLIAPTVLRLAIIWIPVILFVDASRAADAAAYKIATSIAFGALAFVPFHKQTMLSVDGVAPAAFLSAIAPVAILVAGAGALFLIGLAEPITQVLYPSDFGRLAVFLPALGPFLVLQVIVDIALVTLISTHFDRLALVLCISATLVSMGALIVVDPLWYPTLSTGVFCAIVAVARPSFFSGTLILRGAAASLGAVGSAYVVGGWTGLLAGGALFVFALIVDSGLRQVVVYAALHFLRARRTGLTQRVVDQPKQPNEQS
jgi:hypothetical protein